MRDGNLLALLRRLCEDGVDFIVAGGVAAALNGAPVQTLDIDLVYSPEAANLDRLLSVLESLGAVFRLQPERRPRPGRSHLSSSGHLNLIASLGPLNVLGFYRR